MTDKTKEELEQELCLVKELANERKTSNEMYAIKLVERIVFAACGLILLAVVTALVGLVVSKL